MYGRYSSLYYLIKTGNNELIYKIAEDTIRRA